MGAALQLNVQHSAESASWYTPSHIVEAARLAIGGIDFDPASDELAQTVIQATTYASESGAHDGQPDGFMRPWRGRVFLNPPTPPKEWWLRLMVDVHAGHVSRAIFVAYSLEQLQQSQVWSEKHGAPSMLEWEVCIPNRRIAYLRAVDGKLVRGKQPPHASAIVGVGVARSDFARAFQGIGVCL